MLESETGEPHDGRYPLRELVRWTAGPSEMVFSNAEGNCKDILAQAVEESRFDQERVRRNRPLSLASFPFLTKDDVYRNAPLIPTIY